MTPQETDPDLPVCVQESPQRPGPAVACFRYGALSVTVPAWDLLKEVTIIFITSTIVWSHNQVGQTNKFPQVMGGNTALSENWIKN